jgi:hypothetical protein
VRRLLWLAMLTVTMAATVFHPAVCRAQTRCPWLNAATAEGLLGTKVQMNIAPPTAQGDTTCEFSNEQNPTGSILRIVVHTMDAPSKEFASYVAQCNGTTVPLKAIGNEAVQCVLKDSSTTGEEQIIARVRERAFIFTVRRNPPMPSKSGLREDTRNIAEQIAGSLF